MSEGKQTVYKRWLGVLQEFRPPAKRQPQGSGDLSYAYIAWDDLAETLRPLLAKHGLVLDVEVLAAHQEQREYRTGRGDARTATYATVEVAISLTAPDGESITRRFVGSAADSGLGDKAVQKAVTSAVKYWLLKALVAGEPAEDEDGRIEPAQKVETATPQREVPRKSAPMAAPPPEGYTGKRAEVSELQRRLLQAKKWQQAKEILQRYGVLSLAGLNKEQLREVEALLEPGDEC